jgi:hypothetical protein
MNSRTTRQFRALLSSLPAHVRQQARLAYRLFRQNPSHPGLRFKKVHDDPPFSPPVSALAIGPWEHSTAPPWFGFGLAPTQNMTSSWSSFSPQI